MPVDERNSNVTFRHKGGGYMASQGWIVDIPVWF